MDLDKKIAEWSKLDPRYKTNLEGTPERLEKVFDFYFGGIGKEKEVASELGKTFPSDFKGRITLDKLKAVGMCPHHFLPVHYSGELTYIPDGGLVVGTSKAYKALRIIAHQPLLMEDVFKQFIDTFWDVVKPKYVSLELHGQFECNCRSGIERSAEVILNGSRSR